ncbi:MAG TPA: S8 family serine peptidase [Blastocatellia bacterium]|nr:S8 family serine peptidase [Blastocatellia bacterium]
MTKRISWLNCLVAAVLIIQTMLSPVQAAPSVTRTDESPIRQALKSTGTVSAIIELEGAPLVERQRAQVSMMQRARHVDFDSAEAGALDSAVRGEQENFKARARLIAPTLRVRTEVRALANAVSVEARGTEIAALAALPGVKRVELVREFHALLDTSVPLTNAPAMWERLGGSGNAGAGMKIAILDTGIDVTNPLFNDAGYSAPAGFPRFNNGSQALTNNKVIVAKSFVSGADSDPSALDENGHGSNVAGIAAGNIDTLSPLGLICGVAPHAFLGNYRVLGKSGSGSSDLIAAGLDEAVRDGFDVANMSLGSDATAQLDFLARAVESAVDSGMVVAVAAGNSGTDGVGDEMTIGSPAIAPSAITVGSTTNAHATVAMATVAGPSPVATELTNIQSVVGEGATTRFNAALTALPLAEVSDNRGCSALDAGALAGKIALIERGNCNFTDKVNNAAAAGAAAAIIYNKDISEGSDGGDNLIHMAVGGTGIPAVFVTRTAGLALRKFVRAHANTTLNLTPIIAADVVSSFSSRGPSLLQTLKPDIAAPGESIYSAILTSISASGFGSESGTSQATPHIAGAAALVRQLHPTWTPAQVKSALMSSASTAVFTTIDKTTKAGVLAMGAGRVDLAQAASVSATFAPASLSFGILKLKKPVSASQDFQITNNSDQTRTFTLSIQQLDPGDGVTMTLATPATVTLAPGQSTTATLAVDAVKRAEKRDYTGFINAADSQGQTLRLPFWVRFKKK